MGIGLSLSKGADCGFELTTLWFQSLCSFHYTLNSSPRGLLIIQESAFGIFLFLVGGRHHQIGAKSVQFLNWVYWSLSTHSQWPAVPSCVQAASYEMWGLHNEPLLSLPSRGQSELRKGGLGGWLAGLPSRDPEWRERKERMKPWGQDKAESIQEKSPGMPLSVHATRVFVEISFFRAFLRQQILGEHLIWWLLVSLTSHNNLERKIILLSPCYRYGNWGCTK